MTKRRVERLLEQAKQNGHRAVPGDGGDEVTVELSGVPACGPDEDDGRTPDRDDRPGFDAFTVDLDSGEVETPDRPDPDDLPECATPDCPNPSMPFEGESVCEKCADMPWRDWRPVVRENEEGDGNGEDHE
jgi:hypothetical protein